MAIEVEVVGSPGWWMRRLFGQLLDIRRQRRLQILMNYHRGQAPLPQGANNAREAFEDFQRKARSNFAELVVSAVSERMRPVGFRTALDDDATGDAEVGALWSQTGMDVACADVHDLVLSLSEAYVIVGQVDDESGVPLVTCEDPRFVVGEPDPMNPRRLLAAMKVLRDNVANQDRAYLYLPGQIWVASRPSPQWAPDLVLSNSAAYWNREMPAALPMFDPQSWTWDQTRSGRLPHDRIPVVQFRNKYGMGEYEPHVDLLDRINHHILQRMVIAVMQAFRQRAVKNLPMFYPEGHPKAGTQIDYTEVFTSDPAALWILPAAAEMWESSTTDLRPILEAVTDDLEHLAAVTRTPIHMLSPAGERQSAEGASLSREGLVFKVEDRQSRFGPLWSRVMSLVLLQLGHTEQADLSKLQTIWAPAERLSLAERSDAATKCATVLPRRTLFIDILGMSPQDADRAMTEWTDDQLLAAQIQAASLGITAPAGSQSTLPPGATPAALTRAQAGAIVDIPNLGGGAKPASGGSSSEAQLIGVPGS